MLNILTKHNSYNSDENPFVKSKASWIWNYDITEKPNDASNINEYVEFLHEFYVDNIGAKSIETKEIDESNEHRVDREKALLYISADSDYAVYLNGKFINCGQYDDFPENKVYDVLDLSESLQNGKNVLAITVYYQGRGSFQYKEGNPGVIYLLKKGEKEICHSSAQALCRLSPAWKNGEIPMFTFQLGFTFQFDATKYDNWIEEGYVPQIAQCRSNYENRDGFCSNESSDQNNYLWYNALELDDSKVCPRKKMYKRPIEKLEFMDKINAKVIAQGYLIRKRKCDQIPAHLMQTDFLSHCNPSDLFINGIKKDSLTSYVDVDAKPEIDFDKINYDMSEINNDVKKTNGAYIILDLGREEAGLFNMDIEASEGTIIDIGYGEHLDDMRVKTWIEHRNYACRYICKEGRQKFTYYFKRFGCRYIQLHITNAKGLFKIHYAGLIPWEYPVSRNGEFKCNDSLHNKIYEVSERTLHLCMHEHYEDTPWREQALYAMDARNQALCGYYCFGEYNMPRACFELLGMSLQSDGFLEICAPCVAHRTIPSFTMAWITEVWEYILYSGDLDYLHEVMPKVNGILDKHIANMQDGLLPIQVGKQYWNFYEWSHGMDGEDEFYKFEPSRYNNKVIQYDAPYILFFCLALQAAANMAQVSNDECRYEKYMDLINIIKEKFHSIFWDEKEEAYLTYYRKVDPNSISKEVVHTDNVDIDNVSIDNVNVDDANIVEKVCLDNKKIRHFSELTQALALCAGVCSEDIAAILRHKLSLKENNLVKCTISHSIYKYEALMGEPEVYAKKVFEEVAEDWGHMLYSGATSFWETLRGSREFNGSGSMCHGWSAIPIYFYGRYILGVAPISPGFSEFRAEPLLSVFERFSGKVPTPYGDIEIAWDRANKEGNDFSNVLEVNYPEEIRRIEG